MSSQEIEPRIVVVGWDGASKPIREAWWPCGCRFTVGGSLLVRHCGGGLHAFEHERLNQLAPPDAASRECFCCGRETTYLHKLGDRYECASCILNCRVPHCDRHRGAAS